MAGITPTPPATASDIAVLQQQLSSKADVSAVPTPASAMPPAVADNGAKGTQVAAFALADHTHASKARKSKVTVSSATYTWTYPVPFDAGVSPICNGIAQVASGNTDLFNVQIIGNPTNTTCQFQINRVSAGLLSLLLGALSINPTPASITLHLLALEP